MACEHKEQAEAHDEHVVMQRCDQSSLAGAPALSPGIRILHHMTYVSKSMFLQLAARQAASQLPDIPSLPHLPKHMQL